jgi:hypothetical protein
MKQIIRNSLAIAGLMAALSGAAAEAAHLPPSTHSLGQASADGSFERVIRIAPETASVSVYRMETVKFIDEQIGKSFVWRFTTPRMENFPLDEIAPAGGDCLCVGHPGSGRNVDPVNNPRQSRGL